MCTTYKMIFHHNGSADIFLKFLSKVSDLSTKSTKIPGKESYRLFVVDGFIFLNPFVKNKVMSDSTAISLIRPIREQLKLINENTYLGKHYYIKKSGREHQHNALATNSNKVTIFTHNCRGDNVKFGRDKYGNVQYSSNAFMENNNFFKKDGGVCTDIKCELVIKDIISRCYHTRNNEYTSCTSQNVDGKFCIPKKISMAALQELSYIGDTKCANNTVVTYFSRMDFSELLKLNDILIDKDNTGLFLKEYHSI